MGIEKNIKKQLNKEGVEKQGKGEAAVLAGTKEEVEKARELIESEGRAPDLESYIRLHKEIYLNESEVPYNSIISLTGSKPEKGTAWLEKGNLFYVDKNENIANVKIDINQIDSFSDVPDNKKLEEFENKAKELGLHFDVEARAVQEIKRAYRDKEREILEKQERKERKAFNL